MDRIEKCRMKWTKLSMLLTVWLLSVVSALANIQVQISESNTTGTWTDVNTTLYSGSIGDGYATALGLDEGSKYYVRVRNETTTWSYGEIVTEISGETGDMILSITILTLGLNLIVFLLPFFVTFSKSPANDYIIKRVLWLGSLALVWFNVTLLWQLADSYGLGINDFMETYWWIFSFGTLMVSFILIYVYAVGLVNMIREVKEEQRMGR